MENRKLLDYPDILRAEDVAAILRTSKSKAYDLLNSRDFPTLVVGRRKMVSKEKFIEWINSNSSRIKQ
ncbi:MAG: helix-turn-helix domain-containing protein [Eubacteriales bacterium]|nr:helix-turn-helix domain-containing protein [Eubacteriales bacterium]